MKTNMEKRWIDNRRGEAKALIEALPQFNFVLNISHMTFFWIEPCFLKVEVLADNKTIYKISHKPRLNIVYKSWALYCFMPLTSLFTLRNAGSDEMAVLLAMKFHPKWAQVTNSGSLPWPLSQKAQSLVAATAVILEAGEKRYTEWALLMFNEHSVNNSWFVSCYVSTKICRKNAKL